jgi:hypothetical protein
LQLNQIFWFKTEQDMEVDTQITNGLKKLELTVSLDTTDFYRYPYCDTIAYLNKSNISNSDDDYELELKTPMVVQWVMKMMGIMTVMMKTIQMKK